MNKLRIVLYIVALILLASPFWVLILRENAGDNGMALILIPIVWLFGGMAYVIASLLGNYNKIELYIGTLIIFLSALFLLKSDYVDLAYLGFIFGAVPLLCGLIKRFWR